MWLQQLYISDEELPERRGHTKYWNIGGEQQRFYKDTMDVMHCYIPRSEWQDYHTMMGNCTIDITIFKNFMGAVAERLRTGLQSRVHRFESGPHLQVFIIVLQLKKWFFLYLFFDTFNRTTDED